MWGCEKRLKQMNFEVCQVHTFNVCILFQYYQTAIMSSNNPLQIQNITNLLWQIATLWCSYKHSIQSSKGPIGLSLSSYSHAPHKHQRRVLKESKLATFESGEWGLASNVADSPLIWQLVSNVACSILATPSWIGLPPWPRAFTLATISEWLRWAMLSPLISTIWSPTCSLPSCVCSNNPKYSNYVTDTITCMYEDDNNQDRTAVSDLEGG